MVLVPPKLGPRTGFRWMTFALALPLAALATGALYLGLTLGWAWHPERDASPATTLLTAPFDACFAALRDPAVLDLIIPGGYPGTFHAYSLALLIVAAFASLAFVGGFIRKPLGLRLIRLGYGLGYLALAVGVVALWRLAAFLETPPDDVATLGLFGETGTYLPRFWWWYDLAWPMLLAIPVLGLFHLASHRAAAVHLYTGRTELPAAGDKIIEDARTHGRDPVYRKSWLSSAATHAIIIVLIPWLLTWLGCSDRYDVPEGSGDPVVALVKVVKPKKVEKQVFIVNPRSAISFYVPRLEDSQIEEQVEEATELEYEATMAMAGAMGAGGGKRGGWPDGMGRKPVRFIRLKGHGPGWNDGMNDGTRADINFLNQFHQITGFRVAEASEAKTIRQISNFDKGYAPPFIYMTGEGHIRISRDDTRRLREYLLDGGMLFADAGHPNFHRAFTRYLTRELLPDNRLIPIADDDPIFQMPYQFPHGAPPLWHHGGRKAMGVKAKVNGRQRWVVFYHPGDINDAWKTGHSGLDRDTAQGAVHMGVNIIYYAFTHYLEDTRKYRK